MGDFSCVPRSLAALLGNEDALCPVWMKKLELMLSWRDMGRTECKGATFTDMIKPDKAVWIKEGAVSDGTIKYLLHELSPLKLVSVTKNAREVTAFLNKQFAVTAPGEMHAVGLVTGWPQSSFEGRAKKAKKKGEFKSKEEEDVYSIQQVAGDPTRVHVTWAPSKIRTKQPIADVEHLITESNKPVFESGAEVVLEDDVFELSAEQAAQNKQRYLKDTQNAKSGKNKRDVFTKMKKKDAANAYTMHTVPAYFEMNLCRDPMAKTPDSEKWAAGGTDLKEGIWKVLQKNKNSTKVYQLLQKESIATALQRFRDPGPRLETSITAYSSKSGLSSSSDEGLNPQRFRYTGPRLETSSTASSDEVLKLASAPAQESAPADGELLNFQLDLFQKSAQLPYDHDKQAAALRTMSLLRQKEFDAALSVPVRPAKHSRSESEAEIPTRQLRSRK